MSWSIDLFKPFFPPEIQARTIAFAEIDRSGAEEPVQEIDPLAFLDQVIAFVEELFDSLEDTLSCVTVLPHFFHEGAPFDLVPIIEASLNFFPGLDPDQVADTQVDGRC